MQTEKIYRYRVYRVWNIPERPSLHGSRNLVFSSQDFKSAEEFRASMAATDKHDTFIVQDSGKDVEHVEVSDFW